MSWQSSIQAAVRLLQKEETKLERELAVVRQKIRELGGVGKARGGVRGGRRRLSEAGRLAISRAAKRRWASYRANLKKRG
jgi:hypothetical protein